MFRLGVEITPKQREQIRKRQAANILAKLNAGKTITAREQAILDNLSVPERAFIRPLDELARELTTRTGVSVTRKSLQNWRSAKLHPELVGKLPRDRADGRKDVAAWAKAMVENGLHRADEVVAGETSAERKTVRDWKEYREKLMCDQLERSILRDDRTLLVATQIEIAIGQLIAGVSVALDHFAPSAARFVVGLRDIHDVQAKLQSEIDAVKQRINAAHYLDECDEAAKPYLQRIGRQLLAEVCGGANAAGKE